MNKYSEHSQVVRARACIRKRVYPTAAAAKDAMERAAVKDFYKCTFCEGWHITSRIPRGNGGGYRTSHCD